MKKIFAILTIFLAFNNSAWGQQSDLTDMICQVSNSCKKVCELNIVDKFDELSADQKQLTIQCAQDMMQKIDINKVVNQQQGQQLPASDN